MNTMANLFDVRDRIVVITGGSGVLGGHMAKGLAMAGAIPVLLARTEKHLDRAIKELSSVTDKAISYKCDVLDESQVAATNESILSKFGKIDVLINAAGGNKPAATIGLDQSVFDLNPSELKSVSDLNFYGTVLPTLVFGKSMAKKKKGSIINISSMATQRAITRVVGYSAAKAAIENFTRWMAVELARKFGNGIRVNAIAPGFFLTEQNRYLLTNKDGSLTERGRTIQNITPFGRFGNPEELIGTVLWLASDASSFVTGTIIPVDGGFSAFSGL